MWVWVTCNSACTRVVRSLINVIDSYVLTAIHPRETLKPKGLACNFYLHSSESQNKSERKFYAPLFSLNTSSEISFGSTCLYVCAETLSHESPFPKTPRTGSNERAISAASCAAGGANSTNSNKLDSENVNAARIKLSQRCIALNT